MRPLLFYTTRVQIEIDRSHHKFIEQLLEIVVDTYPIEEHESMYDHDEIPDHFPGTDTPMPTDCWCDIPDRESPKWPKLYFNPQKGDESFKFTGPVLAAAGDDIFNLTIEQIHQKFGTKFTGPGPW